MSANDRNSKMTLAGSETVLSLMLVGIVAIMLIPLPPMVLDLLIAANLSSSILLLLITLGVRRALDLSVFPSLLLMMTLYRLSLNVASTRRILLSANGGSLVAAFGNFVVGGNLVVGFVVFLILVLIQFIVITKGAGRVSEVSARFTLDALPGKQLAIDADLNAGMIDEKTARRKRQELGQETEFYGAMDGASKFVRGDAIAGVIITAINLLGGIIIGASNGLSVSDAITTYSILTIGDGLVSQVPALIISVSAGMIVTKMTSENSLGREMESQIMGDTRPIWIGATFILALILVPGLPKFPFFVVGGGLLLLLARERKQSAEKEDSEGEEPDPGATDSAGHEEQDLRNFLLTDRAIIELGPGLVNLVQPDQSKGLAERIRLLRREFSHERGIWIPPIRVRSNLDLPAEEYKIIIGGRVVGSGILRAEKRLAILPETPTLELPGESTREPSFDLPALWIDAGLARQADAHGYTVVDPAGVVVTHLGELLKRFGHELITRETIKEMLERVREFAPTVVDEVKSEGIRMSLLHQVVSQLAAEFVSLSDFSLVLEAIANNAAQTKLPDDLTDAVRMELGQIICQPYLSAAGSVRVLMCDPALETQMVEGLHEGRLALPVATAESLVGQVIRAWQDSTRVNQPITLLVDRRLRRPVRRLIGAAAPQMGIISYQELPPDASLDTISVIRPVTPAADQAVNAGDQSGNSPEMSAAA